MHNSKYSLIIISFLIFITGCYLENNNHGYGYDYDMMTRNGTAIIIEDEENLDITIDPDFIDSTYYDAMNCTGYSAPIPPYILVKKEKYKIVVDGEEAKAAIIYDPPLILIPKYRIDNYEILMHEYIHYILYMNDIDQGPDHHSRYSHLYIQCGATLLAQYRN